ncbi:haloacid dehalogenase-like hydrolase [Streptomyces lunaelactis]|uniref:HAD family hydrolase n=1 Tax=Streptomyces lunaelactis TaxID=1535768 RepID=UPI0015850953|nr:haloacid dehalogenase-like hydrolase [Streptomyces lunaelactis]NUK50095.1 haloacid dehalogenase-like hydrolase [Streptomyces lunaelactis]
MQLVLWDIDHTLIATRGVGREIFGECFEQVTGQAMKEQAAIDGMTEPIIFRETAKLHGIDSDRSMFEAFARCSAETHLVRAGELRERGHALPGAAAALAAVAELDGVVQTVVTGNVRPVAEIKLSEFGLDTHIRFPYGAYGEDDDERAELVRIAMRRTSQGLDVPVAAGDVLLVGDTPADIAAGLANGVRVLAVASGRSSDEELREAGASMVVAGLEDPQPLLHALARP